MNLDVANGCFELGGAIIMLLNVMRLRKDKMLRGVDWRVTGFFLSWGLFNLAYYPSLDQVFSFVAGIAMCCVNFAWLYLAIKFRNN
jgi:hypothetical protein